MVLSMSMPTITSDTPTHPRVRFIGTGATNGLLPHAVYEHGQSALSRPTAGGAAAGVRGGASLQLVCALRRADCRFEQPQFELGELLAQEHHA
jgi:hypothetical protein